MQDVFDKIANASATKGGNNMKDGKYRLVIERCIVHNGHNGVCFIPELRVKTAAKTEADVEPNSPGSTVSSVWNLTAHDSAPGNVKAFVLAALGLEETTATPAQLKELTSKAAGPEQILRGIEIECTTMRRINQGRKNAANRGQVMVLPNWQHVPGQTTETVARNRAELDGATPAAAPTPAPAPAAAPATPAAAPAGGVLAGILGR